MPQFANPFPDNFNEKKMTTGELIQAIRLDIANELEAISLYDAHATATNNINAKKVLSSIRDEEKVHVGELIALLKEIDPEEEKHLLDGQKEIKDLIKK